MDCKIFDEYASPYLDDMLSEQERTEFEAHLENCEECRMKLKNLQLIVESIKDTEEVELPDNFTASLHDKLVAAEQKKFARRSYWKPLTAVAAGLAVLVAATSMFGDLGGLGGGRLNSSDHAAPQGTASGDEYYEEESLESYPEASAPPPTVTSIEDPDTNKNSITFGNENERSSQSEEGLAAGGEEQSLLADRGQRKLIQTGELSLETESFDEVYQQILDLVNEKDGYVQSSESYYTRINRENPDENLKAGYMVVRIPSTGFKAAYEEIKALGIVVNEQNSATDVTLTYRDLENEVTNLEVQEQRLREILERAEEIEDILQIEKELNRVRTQINGIRGSLKNYDQLVSLATLNIQLSEIATNEVRIQTTNDGIWNRAVNQMISNINIMIYYAQMLFIRFFGILPLLALLILVGIPVVIWIRKKIKARRK